MKKARILCLMMLLALTAFTLTACGRNRDKNQVQNGTNNTTNESNLDGTTNDGNIKNDYNNSGMNNTQDGNGVMEDIGQGMDNVVNDVGNGVENLVDDVTGNDRTDTVTPGETMVNP